MFTDLQALLRPAVVERVTLLVNHVLAAEPQATGRLQPHAGRVLRMEITGWPRLLPALPVLAFCITPAGLVEWVPDAAQSDLKVRLAANDPAALALRALAGTSPPLEIDGDARFAADVDWLAKNLRWDLAADLERLFGPAVAHQLERLGSTVARGLRAAIEGASALAGRSRAP